MLATAIFVCFVLSFSFAVARTQVEKTIKTPEAQRKVHGSALVELQTIYDIGSAFENLRVASSKPFNTRTYLTLVQPSLKVLFNDYSQGLELNNERFVTAILAQEALQEGNFQQAVVMIQFWPAQAEAELYDPNVDKRFDKNNPRMWKLLPSDEDEADAQAESPEKPRLLSEQQDWEIARAFDKYTSQFPSQYVTWFACDALYSLMEKDMKEATKYFIMLVCKYEDDVLKTELKNSTKAFQQCKQIISFSKGYISIVCDHPFDQESYNEFRTHFVMQTGEGVPSSLRSLAGGARRNYEFQQREKLVTLCADTEINNYEDLAHLLSLCQNSTLELVHLEGLAKTIKNCTKDNAQIRDDLLIELMSGLLTRMKKTAIAMGQESDVTPAAEKLATLRQFKENFANLPVVADQALTQDAAKLKLSISNLISKHAASEAEDTLRNILATPDRKHFESDDLKSALSSVKDIKPYVYKLPTLVTAAFELSISVLREFTLENAVACRKNLKAIDTTLAAITAKMKSSNLPLDFEQAKVTVLIDKGCNVLEMGFEWQASPTKEGLWTRCNKAYVEFSTMIKYFSKHGNKNCEDLFRTFLEVSNSVRAEYNTKVLTIETALRDNLAAELKKVDRYARGQRDGTRWDKDLAPDADLDTVLAKAAVPTTGLLAGPGKRIESTKAILETAHIFINTLGWVASTRNSPNVRTSCSVCSNDRYRCAIYF